MPWRLIFALSLLAGCDNPNRYEIAGKAPFFQTTVPFHPGRKDAVIHGVQEFARQNRMDFLNPTKELGPGEFWAAAERASLNLIAVHGEDEDHRAVVQVLAIAHDLPTAEDKALVEDFVSHVRHAEDGSR